MKFTLGFVAGFVTAPVLIMVGVSKVTGTNFVKDITRSVSKGVVDGLAGDPGPYRRYSSQSKYYFDVEDNRVVRRSF